MSLNRRKGLASNPDKVRAWQQRSRARSTLGRSQLARGRGPQPVGRKAEREADDLAQFRAVVHARRWCQLGAPACSDKLHEGSHAHHLAPSDRDRGVHDPDRGLLTCPAGHAWVHDNPTESYARGWLLRATA